MEDHKIATDVEMLKKDMMQFTKLVDRIDMTIEKLTEVSSTVSKLLAVQDNRLESQEKLTDQLQKMFEKRKEETDKSHKELSETFSVVETKLYEELESNHEKVIKKIEDLSNDIRHQHDTINDRVSKLEKWMWTAMGVVTVVMLLIDKVNLSSLF